MAGYQFAHMQTYSKKGNKSNRSSTDVLLENSRTPGNHPHVSEAALPNLIHGIDPADVIELIDERIDKAKAQLRFTGKRIQVNTHILNGAVYSHPLKAAQLKIADESTQNDYLEWRKLACLFAIKDARSNGMEVLSIVEHMDEAYPHIHVLSVPLLTDANPRLDAKQCHVGHVAGKQAYEETFDLTKKQGRNVVESTKSAVNARKSAYKDAMRQWQDRYYSEVGVKCGMARLGPARSRQPRGDWIKTQKLSEELVVLTNAVNLTKKELQAYRVKIDEINGLYGENDRLKVELTNLKHTNGELIKNNTALKSTLSDLNVKHGHDLKSMRDKANKEIGRLTEELDQHRPSYRR